STLPPCTAVARSPWTGARTGYKPTSWPVQIIVASGLIDPDKPIRDYTDTELHNFLYREATKVRISNTNQTYEGLVVRVRRSFLSKDRDALQPHIRAFVDRAVTFRTCPDCDGTRLNEAARSSKIRGIS